MCVRCRYPTAHGGNDEARNVSRGGMTWLLWQLSVHPLSPPLRSFRLKHPCKVMISDVCLFKVVSLGQKLMSKIGWVSLRKLACLVQVGQKSVSILENISSITLSSDYELHPHSTFPWATTWNREGPIPSYSSTNLMRITWVIFLW